MRTSKFTPEQLAERVKSQNAKARRTPGICACGKSCVTHGGRRTFGEWVCQPCLDIDAKNETMICEDRQKAAWRNKSELQEDEHLDRKLAIQTGDYYRIKMGESLAYLDKILARIKAEDDAQPQQQLALA